MKSILYNICETEKREDGAARLQALARRDIGKRDAKNAKIVIFGDRTGNYLSAGTQI